MSNEVHENWPERFSREYVGDAVDAAIAAERERCAGICEEAARRHDEATAKWCERRIRGEK